MNNCVLCSQHLVNELPLSLLFSYQPFKKHLVCSKCLKKFSDIEEHSACPGCSRQQDNNEYCQDCKWWKVKYPNIQLNHKALFAYNEMAREFMDQYKFQGDLLLANVFSEYIEKALTPYQKTHIIVPIPLSPLSKATRGFNQVELLLKRANIPYQQYLENDTHGKLQSSKNRKERLQTRQPYHLVHKDQIQQQSKNKILIVDDVYTTGRTILHARMLFEKMSEYKLETNSFSLFR